MSTSSTYQAVWLLRHHDTATRRGRDMKRIAALLALATLMGGCGFIHRTFGIRTEAPAYREPTSTAVWGTWVLRTPDSTAFAGANNVQLALSPGSFSLVAEY